MKETTVKSGDPDITNTNASFVQVSSQNIAFVIHGNDVTGRENANENLTLILLWCRDGQSLKKKHV